MKVKKSNFAVAFEAEASGQQRKSAFWPCPGAASLKEERGAEGDKSVGFRAERFFLKFLSDFILPFEIKCVILQRFSAANFCVPEKAEDIEKTYNRLTRVVQEQIATLVNSDCRVVALLSAAGLKACARERGSVE